MSIRQKLVFLIIAAVLGIIAVGGIGMQGIFSGQTGLTKVGRDSLPSVTYTLRLKEAMMLLSRENYVILSIDLNDSLLAKRSALELAVKDKKEATERFEKAASDYEPFVLNDFGADNLSIG